MLTRRCWLSAAASAAASAQSNPIFEEFGSKNIFDMREIVASTPERTGNWAVKHARLPGGTVIMVWCSTGGSEVSNTNRIWISESADGLRWSDPRPIAGSRAGESVLNPAIHAPGDGSLLLFHNSGDARNRFDLILRRSRDGGKTWSEPSEIPFGEVVVSSVMSNPIRLRDGAIVLPVCYSRPKIRPNHYVSAMMISRDGGERWTRGGEIHVECERGAMEPSVVELSNGELYCLMRTKAGFQYESRSRDAGRTWSAAQPSPFAGPESTGILLRLRSGAILFAWNGNGLSAGKQTPRYPMTVAMSRDDGKTWPWRRTVETTSRDRQLSNHGLIELDRTILLAMNHFQGIHDGKEHGPIVQASFGEGWLLESAPSGRWEESPAPTGAIRIEPGRVTLVSGSASDGATRLISRMPLPAAGTIVVTSPGPADNATGIYFGDSPSAGNVTPLRAGEQRVPIRQAGSWGFYARYEGAQSRLAIRSVRVE